jgi:hypothetical protein
VRWSFLQYATLSGNSSLISDCLTFVVTVEHYDRSIYLGSSIGRCDRGA